MSVIAAALKHMLAANMPHDVILAAVEDMERGLQTDEQAERRRAADRDRQRARRLRISAESADSKDSPRASATHVEDKTSNSENPQKEESKKAARGTRLPDDFEPDISWAISEGLPQPRAITEAASFCDFWRAKPGAGGVKLDWPATWRVWVRKSLERAPPRAGPVTTKAPQLADVFRIVKDSSNERQEREDRGGAGSGVSYLPAVGSR